MDYFDAVLLARIQFAFTVAFHIIFPAFSIGLASYLMVLEALWLRTGEDVYLRLFKYWMKIFAVAFGMGVVSGIVMSYQFGTNWSVFSDKTGPVIGPLMGYEVLSAFFLEAGFLGIMLFGMGRVGKKLHFMATAMVAFGTFFSAFWILAVNSWMQTPAGFEIADNGQFLPVDWWAIIFNPSFPYRLVHMVLAAYLTTALVVAAVGAYHLIKKDTRSTAKVMVSMAMWMLAIVAPLQIVVGDMHGLNTLEHQPAKVAAMEGHFKTEKGASLYLFGLPDQDAQELRYAVGIPKLASLILTHDPDGEVVGLDQFDRAEQPPVGLVFWSFRVMVGLGVLMVLAGGVGLFLRLRGTLYDTLWFNRFLVAMGPSGFVAVLAGWIVTEVGRQPYTVYGVLLTADSVSPVAAPAVAASLIAFIFVYFFVFGMGSLYILRLMAKPPRSLQEPVAVDQGVQAGAHIPAGIAPLNPFQSKPDQILGDA